MRPLFIAATFTFVACTNAPPAADGGTECQPDGFFCSFSDPGPIKVNNGLLVTVTGEGAATEGTAFPPVGGAGTYFVDGWQIEYTQVIVSLANVVISENPDSSPTDQSKTGDAVAGLAGVFAVDLAKGGPIDAKELNGKAVRIGRITNQNKKSGSPAFSTTTRYAFGFDIVPAAMGASNVNLDADGQAGYQVMATNGWSVFFKGTATFKGDTTTPACRTTVAGYDFTRMPKKVNFSFGFAAPVTFKNCINPELMPDDTRGVQTQANDETVAQMTFHLDHPFWEALVEDSPLRWDAIAARKSVAADADGGVTQPTSVDITQADLKGVSFVGITDAQSIPLPIRYCGPVRAQEASSGTLSYNPGSVPVNPMGGSSGLADLSDYMTYNLSTFGHLNNDGLCYPARNFPAP